eukprot:4435580-Prymnesium_polylepis.2
MDMDIDMGPTPTFGRGARRTSHSHGHTPHIWQGSAEPQAAQEESPRGSIPSRVKMIVAPAPASAMMSCGTEDNADVSDDSSPRGA